MSYNLVEVKFSFYDVAVKVPKGTTLLKAAKAGGVQVNALCGGKGSCGKCRGRIVQGKVSESTPAEKEFLTEEEISKGTVLLCQREVLGDVIVETEPDPVQEKGFRPDKGELLQHLTDIDPIVTKSFHELVSPTVNDQVADLDRILKDLPDVTTVDINLLSEVPKLVRESGYCLTSTVFNDQLIALEPGNTEVEQFGIAVDIGTTSVAGYLVNLHEGKVVAFASAANRQRAHGADVISRINYTVEEPDGLNEMKKLVVLTIDEIVEKLLAESGILPEHVYVVTLLGNTVMSHLLLGVSPLGVVSAPFVPAFSRSIISTVDYLGLKSLPARTRFILLPNVAGYVGADTVGVILATKIYDLPGNWLAVDIGTNGEVALSTGGRLLTCSTAAGPAFEGASISQGMRAEPGAIFKVTIDDDVHVLVVGDEEPKGICGSGLVDAVSELVRVGVLKNNGRFKSLTECPKDLPQNIKKRIVETDKGFKFVLVEGRNEVAITQKDISELQLGKGAVRAGIEILLEEGGVQELDGILLAGAFGSNLRPESLVGLGMLPPIDIGRIKPVGNAAGTGAIMALLSKEQLRTAMELPKRIEHIELSLHKGFQRKFARAITF